jgi:hypothetical protein
MWAVSLPQPEIPVAPVVSIGGMFAKAALAQVSYVNI